jgi:glycosidase
MASNKIIIYQIFSRLYGNRCQARKPFGTIEENGCGKLNDFTPTVLKQIREMGVSHVWFTGVIRHATMTDYSQYGIPRQHPAVVKGQAGSPYAITDYYDIDPDLAVDVEKRMEEFEKLVSRTHRAGLKVIIDFVPNHVARQYKSICKPAGVKDLGEDDNPNVGFDPQHNNFYYCPGQQFRPYFDLYHGEKEPYTEIPAKATGNDCFHNAPGMNDWYETVKLNYGVDYYAGGIGHFNPIPNTWEKMLHILLFWAGKGVDAFRCDMAEMVPADFWMWATAKVREKYPDVRFIGEVYNPNEYRRYIASGFDYLYDKVGMYDAMRDVICHRRNTDAITWAWQQTDDIRDHMLYFLENHDEGFSGRDGRTTIFDYWSFDHYFSPLTLIYNKVLGIARTEKAVAEGQMFDVMYANKQYYRQYAFLRKAGKEILLVVVNFDDAPLTMNLTIPDHAFNYLEMMEKAYNAEDLMTGKAHKLVLMRDQSIAVKLQARGAVVFKMKD